MDSKQDSDVKDLQDKLDGVQISEAGVEVPDYALQRRNGICITDEETVESLSKLETATVST
ncbi:hypothetical protein DSO57_1000364 [Entomophthora muscae]|uniref:Uncharacterized protein n=1 Tax=Entomophthora muscae TaxID=34485 RepID=A0ACC2TK40_9FUNG|nr:hypothetical protein DSO57_1000364 [Entomophthora muscae]